MTNNEPPAAQITVADGAGPGVRVSIPAEPLSPAQAREAAAALLRAANEAEGAQPSEGVFNARQHVRDTWIAGNGREAFGGALDVLELAVREDERRRWL